jgi:hypothetical protein
MNKVLFILLLISFSVMGLAFWNLFSGKYEGDRIKRSLRFLICGYRIHIHHWIYCSIILIILLIIKFYNPIILGFMVGSIIQGLKYKDRFIIVYKDADFKKTYSKFGKNRF